MEMLSYITKQLFGRGKKKKIFIFGIIVGYIFGSKYPNQSLNNTINFELIKEKAELLLGFEKNNNVAAKELKIDEITFFSKDK